MTDERLTTRTPRFYGAYPAVVVDDQDPDGEGRVLVQQQSEEVKGREGWARLATLAAGPKRGSWFIPEVGDEVLVMFEAGDPRRPFVVGSLWSRGNPPPEAMDGENSVRSIVTRSGLRISLDDTDGSERVTLESPSQSIVIDEGALGITISDASGNEIRLEPSGITVNATVKVTVAAATVEINTAMLTVNSAMAKYSGVVQCDTLIANSVVASTYSPGAGNVS